MASLESQPLLVDGGINAGPGEVEGKQPYQNNNGSSVSATTDSVVHKVIRRGRRLVSLDATRGFTVCVMIFVDNTGCLGDHVNHSPWDHPTYADFVMPFFLTMVG